MTVFDLSLADLEAAAETVHETQPATPQYPWPLLCERAGLELWVKHENHTRIGAFKVRGGLIYVQALVKRQPDLPGVIAATRGNHGQSVALAARRAGLRAVIVVPHGNSVEKNAAMRALGAELIEEGDDFQESLELAKKMAEAEGLHMFPSFAPELVCGVASYGLELFRAQPDLERVYVPIGLGSGICGVMAARDALDLKTEVVGVVSEQAASYALSFEQGEPVPTNSAKTMADGMACRTPVPEAVAIINAGAADVVRVSEEEIKEAMRAYYTDTHNIAEGAGAAPLAALMKDPKRRQMKKAGVILSGGNIDAPVYREILAQA